MTTTTHQTAGRFAARAGTFGELLDAVGDRWDAPTPCEGWTVRDVAAHAIEAERDFLLRHDLLATDAPDLSDPAAAWRTHAADVVAALARDGVAEREYDGYFGRTTIAATMADFYGWDLVIHGWDVARATGQSWSISDEEAASLGATASEWGDALYGEGICAPAVTVPDDTPAQDRLLARLGRDPSWTPA
ncbi:TIGR03086 family metal-binding protein [Nocardioides euryhalodurans]|uniref:TIGR03086 family protein n=1 Tax=Nocardioides euryhalodurans TaxID=2518370 RepID=A0A4P7GJ49_9ACTN|nr:TIGR03086 family metal-binding protein [Nocardioides euryhalodurans]QBR91651.1 TIGR03086 family protein [Nocardioides euryhalodurans]